MHMQAMMLERKRNNTGALALLAHSDVRSGDSLGIIRRFEAETAGVAFAQEVRHEYLVHDSPVESQ